MECSSILGNKALKLKLGRQSVSLAIIDKLPTHNKPVFPMLFTEPRAID